MPLLGPRTDERQGVSGQTAAVAVEVFLWPGLPARRLAAALDVGVGLPVNPKALIAKHLFQRGDDLVRRLLGKRFRQGPSGLVTDKRLLSLLLEHLQQHLLGSLQTVEAVRIEEHPDGTVANPGLRVLENGPEQLLEGRLG